MSLKDFCRAVPRQDKPKIDQLAKVLKEHLSGVKVFRISERSRSTCTSWARQRTISGPA